MFMPWEASDSLSRVANADPFAATTAPPSAERVPDKAGASDSRECQPGSSAETPIAVSAPTSDDACLRTLLGSCSDGVIWLVDGRIVYVNPAALGVLGARRTDELVGRSAHFLIDRLDGAAATALKRGVATGSSASSGDWRAGHLDRLDHARADIELHVRQTSLSGRHGLQVLVRDRTGQHRAEAAWQRLQRELDARVIEHTEQLRASEERWRAMVTTAPATVMQVDPRGQITLLNRPPVGTPAHRIVGTSLYEYVLNEDVELVRQQIARVIQTGDQAEWEHRGRWSDAEVRCFRTRAGPVIEAGHIVGVLLFSMDVTDYRRMAEDARASEARFRGYFDMGVVGLAITSPAKGWIQVNDRLCEILGYGREELMTLTWDQLTYPDDLAADVAQFEKVLAGETDGYTMEKRFVRKDGRVIHARIAAQCYRHPDGSVRDFVALVEDITQQKWAERDLRRAERLASIGTLAAGIAHEINNPVGGILLSVENLRCGREWPVPVADVLDNVLNLARRTKRIIQNVQRFASSQELARQSVDLNEVLVQARELTSRYALGHGCRVELAGDPALPLVAADRTAMEQVVVNFIRNSVEAEASCIWLRSRYDESCVVLEIADDGGGMSASVAGKVFDPFFTTRLKAGGTGLGLSIAYGIVSDHDGRIEVDSEPGRGSRFTVRLPVSTAR